MKRYMEEERRTTGLAREVELGGRGEGDKREREEYPVLQKKTNDMIY